MSTVLVDLARKDIMVLAVRMNVTVRHIKTVTDSLAALVSDFITDNITLNRYDIVQQVAGRV